MSEFWKADSDEERAEMMKCARGGGSVNPEYKGILTRLVREGKLVVEEFAVVKEAVWDEPGQSWTLGLEGREGSREVEVDHAVYATGIVANINSVPAIQPLLESHPIDTAGGMPCLTKELMWNEEVPLFVTGRLGALRLGPAGPNLEGARLGAEFIAGKIASLISGDRLGTSNSSVDDVEEVDMRRLGLGRQNQFEVLEVDDEPGIG